MIARRFLQWCGTASVAERCEAVVMLAEAYCGGDLPPAGRADVEAVLTLILDDPSPKVRLALAGALAASASAPRALIRALADDVDDVACLVAARSPLLFDADLVDLMGSGSARLQAVIAGRRADSCRVAAAVAEVGTREACLILIGNADARIAAISHRRLAERFGEDAAVRAALLERRDLPVDVRHRLILKLGAALSNSPILLNAVGEQRARFLATDACERATALLGSLVEPEEIPALVEHLRASGQLSTAFLIRAVCCGNIDLFAAALVSLSGRSSRRVRAIVVDGRQSAFRALIEAAGLPGAAAPLMQDAVRIWKDASAGRLQIDDDDVPALVMERVVATYRARQDEAGFAELSALLRRLATETARDTARQRARRMAAA